MPSKRLSLPAWWDAQLSFRASRLCFLLLIVVLPMEAITAIREICMAGAAGFLALHYYQSGDGHFRPTPIFWPLMFSVACAVASLFTAVDFGYTLHELRSEVLKGLLIFFTAAHILRRPQHLRQVWLALLLCAFIMVVAGVILFFSQGGSLIHIYVRAGSLHNGYGTFGTFLVSVWPLIMLAPRGLDLGPARRLWPAMLALTVFAGYLTYSRASWLAMIAESVLVWLVLSRRRLKGALVAGSLALLVVLALLLAPGARHGEKWSMLLHEPEKVGGSAGDLMALWKHSYHYLSQNPFTGIGLGRHSFSKAFPEFRATHQPLLWHAHNMFVDLALQTGLQGLVGLLVVFTVMFWVLWPKLPPAANDAAANLGAAVAIMIVGFSLRNLSDDFFADDSALMFWLLAGLGLGARYLRGDGDPEAAGTKS